VLHKVEPVFETLPGWDVDIEHARVIDDLPEAAQGYVRFVESMAGAPVSFVSVGPDRAQTVVLPR
jgi:adenylosuccinate synthase